MRCQQCKHVQDVFCAIEERNNRHCECGGEMKQIFVPPNFSVWKEDDYWFDSKTKIHISSKRQLLDECKKRGKISIGYG